MSDTDGGTPPVDSNDDNNRTNDATPVATPQQRAASAAGDPGATTNYNASGIRADPPRKASWFRRTFLDRPSTITKGQAAFRWTVAGAVALTVGIVFNRFGVEPATDRPADTGQRNFTDPDSQTPLNDDLTVEDPEYYQEWKDAQQAPEASPTVENSSYRVNVIPRGNSWGPASLSSDTGKGLTL